jgi:large subunit ribosomal protein L15
MPLQRRVPKFGFKNINRIEYKAVNLAILQNLAENKNITDFSFDVLRENGIVSKNDLVKILGNGELKTKINVTAHKFSTSAKASIEAQGGSCSEI